LHGITKTERDTLDETVVNVPASRYGEVVERDLRISLTIRNVKKTVNMSKLFGKKK
jgi:hypothetical protein